MEPTTQRLMMGSSGAALGSQWIDKSVFIPDGSNGYVDYLNDISKSSSAFVAVGEKATIMRSTDGITWTRSSPPTGTSASLSYLAITYNSTASRFVAISATTIMYSNDDGVTWTNAVTGLSGQLDIHFANGVYVIVGVGALIRTSTDGIVWTTRSAPAGVTDDFYSVTWGNPSGSGANGRWVVIGQPGSGGSRYIYSNDSGATWVNITSNTTEAIYVVIWAGSPINLYVVTGYTISTGAPFIRTNAAGNAAFSTVYTNTAQIGSQFANCMYYTGSTLLIGGEKGQLVSSTNGTSFTVQRSSPSLGNAVGDILFNGIEYNSSLGRYVFVGNQIQYASGLTRSTATIVYANTTLLSCVYASGISGGLYVFSVGNGAIVFTTTDFVSITGYYLPVSAGDEDFSGYSLITNGSRVILAGSAGGGNPRLIYSTTDGVNWTLNYSSATAGFGLLAGIYGNLQTQNYMFVGFGDNVVYSADGVSWTSGTQTLSSNYHCAQYTNDPLIGASGFALIGGTASKLENCFDPSFVFGNSGPIPTGNTGGSTRTMRSIVYRQDPTTLANSRYIYALDGTGAGYLVSSPYDWSSFSTLTMGAANTFVRAFAIKPPNGTIVAAGYAYISFKFYPRIQTSPDGVNWTSRTVPSYEGELRTALYTSDYFVVAGTKGIILVSET